MCNDIPEGFTAPLDVILGNTNHRKADNTPKSPKSKRGGANANTKGGHKRSQSGGRGSGSNKKTAVKDLTPVRTIDHFAKDTSRGLYFEWQSCSFKRHSRFLNKKEQDFHSDIKDSTIY